MSSEQPNVPYGYCYCGCGERAPIAKWTDKRWGGRVKGEPCRYIIGHSNRIPIEQRFWEKTEKTSGCWLWHGSLSADGYGRLASGQTHIAAYRFAYELLVGPIPEELELDHLCRNRRCVNPDHLEPVTRHENWRRGQSPSAVNARKTHCPKGHAYTPENTYITPSTGYRLCRTCQPTLTPPNPKEFQ